MKKCNVCGIYRHLKPVLVNRCICKECADCNYLTTQHVAEKLKMSFESLKQHRINKNYDLVPIHDAKMGKGCLWREDTITKFIEEIPILDNDVINILSNKGVLRKDIAKKLGVTKNQLNRHCRQNKLTSFTYRDFTERPPSLEDKQDEQVKESYNKIMRIFNKSIGSSI